MKENFDLKIFRHELTKSQETTTVAEVTENKRSSIIVEQVIVHSEIFETKVKNFKLCKNL